jgi:hypothetical protein
MVKHSILSLTAIEDVVVTVRESITFILKQADNVLNFVVTIANKVITIVLDIFLHVLKALNFLLKLIGIDISKVS